MPYDAWSIIAIVVAALCLALASRTWLTTPVRLALVLTAALVIRADAGWQRSLHPWDERYHAVVARNLIAHPLTPMLYARPAADYDYRDWMANQVWLHKPPLALWLMSASLATFGVDDIALRLPSLILSLASVFLTGLIGAHVFGARVGLLAAGFHAVSAFLVSLAAGRRVADHVDTALIFWIEAGAYFALTHTRRSPRATTALVGLAMGAAILTKSWPALLILIVAAAAWSDQLSGRQLGGRLASLVGVAALLAAPWFVYLQVAFPEEAAWTAHYALRHLWEVIEEQAGPWWSYLADAPRFFGELIWIPVAWFLIRACRSTASSAERALAAWIVVPYTLLSAAATKMPNFVMIAAPALFIAQAAFWITVRDRWYVGRVGVGRATAGVLLVLLLMLPARPLLDPTGPFEARDRSPADTGRLRTLDARIGLADAVVFNLPQDIEAMFYSRYTVYSRMPYPGELDRLQALGRPVIIHSPPGVDLDLPASRAVVVRDLLTP